MIIRNGTSLPVAAQTPAAGTDSSDPVGQQGLEAVEKYIDDSRGGDPQKALQAFILKMKELARQEEQAGNA